MPCESVCWIVSGCFNNMKTILPAHFWHTPYSLLLSSPYVLKTVFRIGAQYSCFLSFSVCFLFFVFFCFLTLLYALARLPFGPLCVFIFQYTLLSGGQNKGFFFCVSIECFCMLFHSFIAALHCAPARTNELKRRAPNGPQIQLTIYIRNCSGFSDTGIVFYLFICFFVPFSNSHFREDNRGGD